MKNNQASIKVNRTNDKEYLKYLFLNISTAKSRNMKGILRKKEIDI